MRIIVAVCLLFLGFAVTPLRAEDLSYHGWSGSALYINNQFFIGCRLESPAAVSEPHDPIRVAAGSTKEFAIQFTAHFADPQPKSGQTAMVELALVNGENISSDSWTSGGYSYPTKVLSNGTGSDGKPVTQILLTISTDDPINARLKDATRMKVYWQPTTPGLTDINFSIFDLRHRSVSNPATLLSALDANDTYGAIQAVIACVRNHANVAATPPINTPPANTPPAANNGADANAGGRTLFNSGRGARAARIGFGSMYISPEIMNDLHVQQSDLADAFTLRDATDGALNSRKQSCVGNINLVKEWFDTKGQSVSSEQMGLMERMGLVLMAAAFAAHPDGLQINYTIDASNPNNVTVSVQNPITLASWVLNCGQCGGW